MFRRSITSKRTARDLGVLFTDGHGVSTHAERSAQRLDAARTSAAMKLSRI
ncbi:hypothetical protein [Catenulispora subtropica]|uniref:Uncharacterized protein n=1 Tax=Catenulispora subtropica TaxID=450798 RepID=A0ABN2STP2_9ACTN